MNCTFFLLLSRFSETDVFNVASDPDLLETERRRFRLVLIP